jgi:hypothetical protein
LSKNPHQGRKNRKKFCSATDGWSKDNIAPIDEKANLKVQLLQVPETKRKYLRALLSL